MNFLEFKIFGPKIYAGVTTENVKNAKIPDSVFMNQVHGDKIVLVEKASDELIECDALISQAKGLKLFVKSADCMPLVMADEERGIIAAVHAGWRGIMLGIIQKALAKMREMGAEKIKIGIGPSLGFSCSEFSDPLNEIPEKYHYAIEDKKVDLKRIALDQILACGILEKNIEHMDICTKCDSEFFSFRRDGTPKRFGTMIEFKNLE